MTKLLPLFPRPREGFRSVTPPRWTRGRVTGLVLLLMLAFSPALRAQYAFTTNNGALTITGYSGSESHLSLPGYVYGLPVTGIGPAAFAGADTLMTVSIPRTITSIAPGAFSFCGLLTSFTVDALNPAYSGIGGVLFNNNKTRPTLIQYPAGRAGGYIVPQAVFRIESGAFAGATGLTAVQMTNGITQIGAGAFESCTSLTRVSIPDSVLHLGDWAFANCGSLTNAVLSPAKNIGAATFLSCSNLASIVIPSAVTNVGGSAFWGCAKLQSVTLTNGLTGIDADAFAWCTSLGRVALPQTVSNLGQGAFYSCTGLTNVALGAGLTNIGEHAFAGCTGLKDINIPKSVTTIGAGAFAGCSGLAGVTMTNGVTSIGRETFAWCTSLTGLAIPETVKGIAAGTFYSCTNLVSVRIPIGMTRIESDAFAWCTSLQTVTVPKAVTTLGDRAFAGCMGLISAYFQGPPPRLEGPSVFAGAVESTVYYIQGTAGWGPTYGGRPTAIWSPYATAAAQVMNGFVISATVVDPGYGYTNTPGVTFQGGGGTGAQATAVVSNGVVVGIRILNAGSGYTEAPAVVIAPPFTVPLVLRASVAVRLSFPELEPEAEYQLQRRIMGRWQDLGPGFAASNDVLSIHVDQLPDQAGYRLAKLPLPLPATAVPKVVNGFLISAAVTSGGSGYESVPAVRIVGGGGSGADATATVLNGGVVSITIQNAGSGYTGTPAIEIDPPFVPGIEPTIGPVILLRAGGLSPGQSYQLQTSADLIEWEDAGAPIDAGSDTISQYLPMEAGTLWFRLRQIP